MIFQPGQLLLNAQLILSKHEQIASVTGENYNIFKILSLERNEVKTHSAIVGDLLHPCGLHGLGIIPLNLFLSSILSKFTEGHELDSFDIDQSTTKVWLEEHVGHINEQRTEGGRIDIVIKDKVGNAIIIENKIDASEQDKQLIRYNSAYPKAPILFLTLFNQTASSAGDLIEGKEYVNITYAHDIIEWVKECVKEAAHLPLLRETLNQYLFLLQKLTFQSRNKIMQEELRSLITESTASTISSLFQELQAIIAETRTAYFSYVNEVMKSSRIDLSKNKYIDVGISEDGTGIYVHYQLINDGTNDGKSQESINLKSLFAQTNKKANNSDWNFGWYFPIVYPRKQKFDWLPKDEIVKMHNDRKKLEDHADRIIHEEKEINKKFREILKNTGYDC